MFRLAPSMWEVFITLKYYASTFSGIVIPGLGVYRIYPSYYGHGSSSIFNFANGTFLWQKLYSVLFSFSGYFHLLSGRRLSNGVSKNIHGHGHSQQDSPETENGMAHVQND